ncbi:MAG: hypothetical protein K8U57_14190 [Planctomycetes bacterium]|nr:hypothetical protein [Planctomycetota bacterium]
MVSTAKVARNVKQQDFGNSCDDWSPLDASRLNQRWDTTEGMVLAVAESLRSFVSAAIPGSGRESVIRLVIQRCGFDPDKFLSVCKIAGEVASGRWLMIDSDQPYPDFGVNAPDPRSEAWVPDGLSASSSFPDYNGPDEPVEEQTASDVPQATDRGHTTRGVQTAEAEQTAKTSTQSSCLSESGSSGKCAFVKCVNLALAGKVLPRADGIVADTSKVTKNLRLLASVAWHLAGRRSGNGFTLGVEQTAKLLDVSARSASSYIHRLEGLGVVVRLRTGNNLEHKVSQFRFVGSGSSRRVPPLLVARPD